MVRKYANEILNCSDEYCRTITKLSNYAINVMLKGVNFNLLGHHLTNYLSSFETM